MDDSRMAAKRQTRGVHRRKAATVDDALRAWELRSQRKSLREIAKTLGLSGPQQASNLLERGFSEFYSPKVEQRRAESEQMLGALLADLLPVARSKKRPLSERLDTIKEIVKIDRELRAIHGTNAPERKELTGADGEPLMGSSAAEAARLVRETFGAHAAKSNDDDAVDGSDAGEVPAGSSGE